MKTCSQHHCPLIPLADREVCFLEHARSLLGQPVTDILVTDGQAILLFPGGRALPLVGWQGNRRARDPESAEALLDVLDGLYLTDAVWAQSRGWIALGDSPQRSHWRLHLHPEK